MRLYLLPISTRRTLIYCQRLNVTTTNKVSLLDKTTTKANNLWNSWEKKDSGWQKKVVEFGNKALKRIPYEEWGLKSVPPLSKRRQEEGLSDKEKVEVSFPSTFLPRERVLEILEILGTERKQLHKTRLWGSIIGMPIVAPLALVPIIPNLPFFYLCFRAYSHWKALAGSKHIEFLLKQNLIAAKPSKILDELYLRNKVPFPDPRDTTPTKSSRSNVSNVETMLLHASDGKEIAKALDIPELQMELDRAVWQVENDLEAKRKLGEEKEQMGRTEEESKKK
ncbi:38c4c122-f8a6-442e-a741-77935f86214e [Sclerotinia trifoliorum]|uniref:38c4c122-f8a6-442e-a741-77935f86214e n=1 Tax=Sclerotinia trifoliorum TaxID=28548 RepID=A0A8H2ZRZ0_9HELO|nr:38c4c122-f8a6-442e-a741-77935f86214e [Sclerotinia trifoliorum]